MSADEAKIAKFLLENVKPLKDSVFGEYYRAAAYLRDGTYLPCVMFGHPKRLIDLAIRRFAETRKKEHEHRLVAGAFVARASSVPVYDVARVELSPYAWPEETLRRIHGETSMGWTSFTAKMKDGRVFAFGTPFNFQFFDLPEGYTYEDIVEIHSGMIVDQDGVEKEFSHDRSRECYRDRPFFYCYTECLPES